MQKCGPILGSIGSTAGIDNLVNQFVFSSLFAANWARHWRWLLTAELLASPLAARLCSAVRDALEDLKGKDIVVLDVSAITDFTDYMIIATGTSSTHVRGMMGIAVDAVKAIGIVPIGIEGENTAEWVLLDFGEVVVHLMQASTRDYYDLERLWSSPAVAVSGRSPPLRY